MEFDYDVALSFAGEDRAFVRDVAERLTGAHGLRVFYDEFEKVEMWGEDLFTYLDDVYRQKARYAVVFISRHYVQKRWTNHERRSTQARALDEQQPYLLPVRLDDSELPGLPETIGYVDARREGIDGVVALIVEKIGGTAPVDAPEISRAPRTSEEEALLLAVRPAGWEYLLFAGRLRRETDELDGLFYDFEIGFAQVGFDGVNPSAADGLIREAFARVNGIIENFNRLLSPDSTQRAFGLSGEPGDAARIIHLAERLVLVYWDLMNWSEHLRGVPVPTRFRPVADALAAFATDPVRQFRDFVDKVLVETDKIPEHFRNPDAEPLKPTLTLKLSLDEQIIRDFEEALSAAERAWLDGEDE